MAAQPTRRAIDMRASLAQLAAGGLPLRATERLAEEAGPGRKLFTSDLSVNEFLMARDAGCEPIAQVMGTSIFHIGQIPDYKGKTAELTVISDGHREARRAALSRLFQEAKAVGADAVIGAHLRERMITMGSRGKGGDDGGEVLEFTVVGTAVRAPFLVHPPGQPIVTDLSGQDLWALAQEGWEPCAFLFEFCRYHGWHVTAGSGGFGELGDAKKVVDQAREIATTRMLEQAERNGAEFVIGSDITIKVKEVPCGFAKCTRDDLDVDISWFGTGIRRIGEPRRVTHEVPPLMLSMMTVGRGRKARDNKIGADDDDENEVVLAAEEAEELALQADEDLSTGTTEMQPVNQGDFQLPTHARERLADMRSKRLFTSDLSVNEFLLVKEAGFDPLGLVMGSSIYQIAPQVPSGSSGGCELVEMTRALYHARELAMNRMEQEAEALGADGVIGMRLEVSLSTNPMRNDWTLYREWREWAKKAGFPERTLNMGPYWQNFRDLASVQWSSWCRQQGWVPEPLAPWARPRSQVAYALGQNVAEFVAIGTAVRHREGEHYRNKHGKPFQSDLNGQDFWTLIRCGFRPVGFVMGNCVYYVPPALLRARQTESCELTEYTHALYDARELAIERLQDEAEVLDATGIVGVTVAEREHSWRTNPYNVGNAALTTGEVIELFVVGTAVVPMASGTGLARPMLVLSANDAETATESGE